MFMQKTDPPAGSAHVDSIDAVQAARMRARHRLIGAIVLLVIGVIGFPLVFETQPRPIPVDIPIEIPRRDAMPPLAMPSAAANTALAPLAAEKGPVSSGEVVTESRSDAGRDVTPVASSSAPASASAAPPGSAPAPTPVARPASKPVATAAPKPPVEGERAQALLEGRPVVAAMSAPASPASPAEGARFVLQVGAFADAESARESRKRVEKLGLKTYTQVAQTPGGSRIRVRVGPFASRADADAALAKVKSAGHAGVVLTL